MLTKDLEREKIPGLIGQSVGRIDAQEKVTGAAVFADDIEFGPGLLYARVVAVNENIAERALELIDVEYEPLAPVFDPEFAAGYSSSGPYEIANVKTDSLCVYTNHPVGGAFRGFGMPEMHAGLEQCIDELAVTIDIDPVEFRRLNCLKTGSSLVTGSRMHPTGLPQCIDRVAEAIQWGKKSTPAAPHKRRGQGIALMWKAPAMPPNAGSSAVLELAAAAWDEAPDDLDIHDGVVFSYRSEESMPLKDMVIYGLPKADGSGWHGGPIVGRGNFMPTYVTGLDPETGQGERAVVHYTTGAEAVEVEVDLETGRVEMVHAAAAFDVGRAINPELVKAQVEGGFVQGISTALFESLQLKEGVLQNPSFVDYRIATSADAPADIQTFIVEVPQDDGPWGARCVGEHPMVPTILAIANAIYNAAGVRLESPPFTTEKVYLALVEAGVVA